MNPAKLRAQCLSHPEGSTLILRCKGERLVGHAFATKWACGVGVFRALLYPVTSYLIVHNRYGWITQPVVDVGERRKYIVTSLLQALKDTDWCAGITMMAVVSSQPATCHVLCKMLCT